MKIRCSVVISDFHVFARISISLQFYLFHFCTLLSNIQKKKFCKFLLSSSFFFLLIYDRKGYLLN